MKCKMMITLPQNVKNALKKHSEKSGVSMSGLIGLAIMEYIPDEKIAKPDKIEPLIVSCSVVTCRKTYDASIDAVCPKCGNSRVHEISETAVI